MVKATRNSFSGDLFKQQFPGHASQNQQTPTQPEPRPGQPAEIPQRDILPAKNDNHFDANA
jgi:hypothetical protein